MGDLRYEKPYEAVRSAPDQPSAIHSLRDEQVVEALTASALAHDDLLANVLATEATNRMRRLRAALANLGEGVLALGLDGTIQWMNPAAERLLRTTWRESGQRRLFDELLEHLDEGHVPVAENLVDAAARGLSRMGDGECFRLSDGGELCVTYTSAPILGPDGAPQGAVIAFQDCAARKQTERELRESRERYKSLFDKLDLGIVSVARDGAILDANPAAERITARRIAEARGKPWSDFLHPADATRALELFASAMRGDPVEARLRILHRDGYYIEVDVSGIPIVVDSNVVGLHGFIRPV